MNWHLDSSDSRSSYPHKVLNNKILVEGQLKIKMNNKINSNELRSINSETAQRTVESSSSASKEGGKGAPGDEATSLVIHFDFEFLLFSLVYIVFAGDCHL